MMKPKKFMDAINTENTIIQNYITSHNSTAFVIPKINDPVEIYFEKCMNIRHLNS